jgi:hypothetical protein
MALEVKVLALDRHKLLCFGFAQFLKFMFQLTIRKKILWAK